MFFDDVNEGKFLNNSGKLQWPKDTRLLKNYSSTRKITVEATNREN